MTVRVKICGITRPEDAAAASDFGADFVGINFWAGSKRHVTLERARALVAEVSPPALKVGVFVNAAAAEIQAIVADLGLDLVQFHGDEEPEACEPFAGRYIIALPVHRAASAARYPGAVGVLIDAPSAGYGGSGATFDWSLIAPADPAGKPLFLAGGLHAGNVGDAVRAVRPFAVDVASGVEASPGIKDLEKMRAFIAAARTASS